MTRIVILALAASLAVGLKAQEPAPLKLIATIPIPGLKDGDFDHFAPDVEGYDAKQKRIYLAGDQFVDVFQQKDADHYSLLAKIPGAFRAKTGILVPELNRYYLAVPHHAGKDAEVRGYDIQP